MKMRDATEPASVVSASVALVATVADIPRRASEMVAITDFNA